MAPSAGWGKFVFVIFLLLFKFCVIILGLAGFVLWRAYSHRRRVRQLEQASAVGQTLGQIEVYTSLIGRTLKDHPGERGYDELFASQTHGLKVIARARSFHPHFPTFYGVLKRLNALLNDFYRDLSLGSITRDQIDRFHSDLDASIKELSVLAPYDPGLKDNPLLNCIMSIYEGFSDVAYNLVEAIRGRQRDNPVYASFFERASNVNLFGGNFTTYVLNPGVQQELASIRRLLYIQFGFLFG